MVQSNLRQLQTQFDLKVQELKIAADERDSVHVKCEALDKEFSETKAMLTRVTKEKDRLNKDTSEAQQQLEQERDDLL